MVLCWHKYILSFDIINLSAQSSFLPMHDDRISTNYWSLFLLGCIIHSVFISSHQLFISLWSWEIPLINHLVSQEMGYVKITSLWFSTDVISSDAKFTLGIRENILSFVMTSQIAKFMGPTWGPPGSCRPQIGPMLAPWTLLSGFGS